MFYLVFDCARSAGLTGLTPDELLSMQEKGALVVDVRTPQEWKNTGLIAGSKGLTFFDATGGYDQEGWIRRLKPLLKSSDQPVILVCRSGSRSSMVGRMLLTEGGFSKVYQLDKGLIGWKAEGLPLTAQ